MNLDLVLFNHQGPNIVPDRVMGNGDTVNYYKKNRPWCAGGFVSFSMPQP
jgi:hypothetical protein